jgi:hypothetical protein
MAVLNVFNLGFKVDNGCGLMVEGGGSCTKGGGSWRLGYGGTDWEAAGLGLAARPEEEWGAGLVGRGVGWWAGRLGPASRPRLKEWAGRWAGKES